MATIAELFASSLGVYFVSLSLLMACTSIKADIYGQCKEQIEKINKMRLNVAYLVPVDSLGQYMNDEVISDDMYNHCEVVANINPGQVHTLAILYFDHTGKVRKSIEWWSDGGDLRNVGYYDEQGNLIYAVYDYYDNNCGKLYITDSKRYIEHPFSQSDYSCKKPTSALKTSELASQYKVHLQMPDNCNTVSFMPIKKGDYAFLCTNRVYSIPKKDMVKSDEAQWGRLILVDSIANDWCCVRIPTYKNPLGYVPIDCIELIEK